MKILYIGRGAYEFGVGAEESAGMALTEGFKKNDCEVTIGYETDHFKKYLGKGYDFVVYPKLRNYPRWLWEIAPTIGYYGDYRPPGHSDVDPMLKATHLFTNFDDGRGTFLPYPVYTDAFAPVMERDKEWLWTGTKASYGGAVTKEERDGDVDCLPSDTIRYGWKKAFEVQGRDYINLIRTHKYGLSVSHLNNVNKHTSNRLMHYISGGITPAVRYFPGVEDFVPDGAFIYAERDELIDFIQDPVAYDEWDMHNYAKSWCDGEVVTRQMLEKIDSDN